MLLLMVALMLALGYSFVGIDGLIWTFVFSVIFIGVLPALPPVLIVRLQGGKKLSPYQASNLYRIAGHVAQRAGLEQAPILYYLPTRALNAFATGSKKEPIVALSAGLLQNLNTEELAGVIAHEISHITNRDMVLKRVADYVTRLTRMFSFIGRILIIINLPLLFMGYQPISWVAILLLLFGPFLINILNLALSRTREYEADAAAVQITQNPIGLARALEKLEHYNSRMKGGVRGWQIDVPEWLRTHPYTKERIRRLTRLAGS